MTDRLISLRRRDQSGKELATLTDLTLSKVIISIFLFICMVLTQKRRGKMYRMSKFIVVMFLLVFTGSALADLSDGFGIIAGVYGRIIIDDNGSYAYTVEVFPYGSSNPVDSTSGTVAYPGVDYPMITYGVYAGSGTTYVDVKCTITNQEVRSITHYHIYSVCASTGGACVVFDFSSDGTQNPKELSALSWASIKNSF